ncbi:hypothetical protein CASFOL_005673 [Castilleja foliolosa]|uniref:Gnk2-homologous domain-containing protein n=1 Tax=Castilleja foliolosa TaxID=1961234 RepID=A0ABD3E835_9LAMI
MNNNLVPHNNHLILLLLLLLVFFLVSNSIIPSQCEELAPHLCGTNNGTQDFSTLLDSLLPDLASLTYKIGSKITNGSYSDINGTVYAHAYALAQCRGDYSISFYGDNIRSSADFVIANKTEVKDSKDFSIKLIDLMDEITGDAITSQNWNGKGKRVLLNNDTLYALLQCNMDLEYDRCNQCLTMAKTKLGYGEDCYNRQGCQVLFSSCYLCTELYPFFYNAT